jgi:hypothetical protein
MKYTIAVLWITATLISCEGIGQTQAIEKANEIRAAIETENVAVSATGYTLRAKIDGKEWVASSMVPPEKAGRIVGHFREEYIGLPFSKSSLSPGKEIVLGEDEAADLFIKNGCLWKDIKGKMSVTKQLNNTVEGRFYFTAVCSSTNKIFTVSDGFFRIITPNQ